MPSSNSSLGPADAFTSRSTAAARSPAGAAARATNTMMSSIPQGYQTGAVRVRAMTTHEVTTGDGRTLAVLEAGAADGPGGLSQHGTPGSGRLYRTEVEGAERLGLRLLAYSRPGYAGSAQHPGRGIADAATDVAAIMDALAAERFATYGWSGGGPHALACAALLDGRCVAAATLAGGGPADAPGFDFIAGMGGGNIAEVGAARGGRGAAVEVFRAGAGGVGRGHPG